MLFDRTEIAFTTPNGKDLLVHCGEATKEKVKELIPSIRRQGDAWLLPANRDSADALRILKLPFTTSATKWAIERKHAERDLRALSASLDDTIDLPGFGKKPFPFQCAGIKYVLQQMKVIIGDEMGCGKTIQALGALWALMLQGADCLPALIVAPSSNKIHWAEQEIPACMPGVVPVLATKKTTLLELQAADIIVTNYEQLLGYRSYHADEKQPDGTTKLVKKRTCWTGKDNKEVILSPLAEKIRALHPKTIICDEAHKIKDAATGQTSVLMAIRHSAIYRMLLTGTPMLNDSKEFYSLLKFLDQIHHFGGYWHFMTYYCGLEKTDRGMEAKQNFHSLDLNAKLRSLCYIRRRKKDVLTQLPEKVRCTYMLEIDNRAEYKRAENELIEWTMERVEKDKKFLESIAQMNPEQKRKAVNLRRQEKAIAAENAEEIVRIGALKTVAVEGKLRAAKEWIRDFLESGEKLVVFATLIHVLDDLERAFKGACRIRSEDSPEVRQANVKRFQNEPKAKLLIGAMGTSAGSSPAGVGHTLTAASNVLFLEFGWNPAHHDQCEDRCHRIGQKDSVTCHYLMAQDTIEDGVIVPTIEGKRAIGLQVVDGIESEADTGILSEVRDWLIRRGEQGPA